MKTLTIPVTDGAVEKFLAIQKRHDFPNQSDCLEFILREFVDPFAGKKKEGA